mmetsp:Transcript_24154/g.54604  ORF Transcript_24154/g.54604 Transcript_24154/m.54604 type:complete len:407 (+) Transcript_24154:240-1460(+)
MFGGQQGFHAPVASNPFAPAGAAAAPMPVGAVGGGAGPDSPTGPMLGKGSELQRMYTMPHDMGHASGINCMVMADGKIYTGGRDNSLFVWRGEQAPGGGFQLVQDCPPIPLGNSVTSLFYEPASKWLFCGLWNGEIAAFCKEPIGEDRMAGHRRSVASITVHSSVVISGSNDGTVRLWTFNAQTRRFACHGQPLQNPSGPVNAVKVLGNGLWVAGQSGITCFDLESLQARGTITSVHPVTGLLECQGYMLATFRSGDVKIYDSAGAETYHHPSRGDHTSNTAMEIMMHPTESKPMLLCGQTQGYVTAYDLPDFRPRGSFVCKPNSDVKAILDTKHGGMFLTGGMHGDIQVWQWGAPPQFKDTGGGHRSAVAANPFAPASAAAAGQPMVAASPFAPAAPSMNSGMMG